MKIGLSLCCMTLAMLLHPTLLKNQSGSAFRIINNHHQTGIGSNYFDSMAITSAEDFKAFLEEISRIEGWRYRQNFIDILLNAQINFDHEALVLLRYDNGYGAIRVPFETPVLQDKTLLCEIRDDMQGGGLGVMAYHCIALAVSKSLVNKVQLKVVGGLSAGDQPTILSTTERQPLKMRRDPPPPPQPAPGECPKLTVSCPTDLLETGKTYEVKVLVDGEGGINPKYDGNYNWSVTGGEIIGGQGTRGLVVRIKEPNKMLEVWVSLGGLNPHCDAVTSCSCGPSK